MKSQKIRIARTIFEKKNKIRGIHLLDFKTYVATIVTGVSGVDT